MNKRIMAISICLVALLGLSVIFLFKDDKESTQNNTGTANTLEVTNDVHEHTYADELVVQASCEEDGYIGYVCNVCGFEMIADTLSALGHNWSEWEITQEATSTTAGIREHNCVVCGKVETSEIAMLPEEGHEHDYEITTVAATCTKGGYQVYTCACGDSYQSDNVAALGHDWSEWIVTTEPTTSSTGVLTRTCKVCGEAETEVMPKLDPEVHVHSYTSAWVDATCTKGGYMQHTCACGHVYQSDNDAALGHSYGDWEITVEPTTSSTGERQCVCSACGDIKVETIPALEEDTSDGNEGCIDPRIEVTKYGNGAVRYYYADGGISVIDSRTWGGTPNIRVNEDGSLTVIYHQTDGTQIEVSVPAPPENYIRRCVILNDGTYLLTLVGDPS